MYIALMQRPLFLVYKISCNMLIRWSALFDPRQSCLISSVSLDAIRLI